MANPFTPEEVSQILEAFFAAVGTRQYIGARYVPIFGRKDETSIEWDNSKPYEPLTIVLYQGNSFTSRQYVPAGVEIDNQEFWANTGNYNAQIEEYRRVAQSALDEARAAQNDIDTLLPKADFGDENTVKDYIDASVQNVQNDIDTLLPKVDFSAENTVSDAITTLKNSLPSDVFTPTSTVNDAITSVNNTISGINERLNGLNFNQCVDFYGADPTGVNDSSAGIQAAIEANPNGVIWFSGGTYKVSEPIVIPVESDKRVSIDMRGSTIMPTETMPYLFGFGYDQNLEGTDAGYIKTFIINGFLLNGNSLDDNLNASIGIAVNTQYKNLAINNMNLKGFRKGIQLGRISGYPTDTQITDCLIRYFDTHDTEAVGIEVLNTDNKFFNLRIYGYHYAFDLQASGSFINQVHVLPKNTSAGLEGSAFARCAAGARFDNCYCDTLESFAIVNVTTAFNLMFDNCVYYTYIENMNSYFVNFTGYDGNSGASIYMDKCAMTLPTPIGTFKNRSIKFNPNDNNVNLLHKIHCNDCVLNNYRNGISGDLMSSEKVINTYWNNANIPAGTWVPFCIIALPTTSTRPRIDVSHTHYFADPQTLRIFGNFSYDTTENAFDFSQLKFDGTIGVNIGASGNYDATQNIIYIVLWYTAKTASTNTNFSVINNNPDCHVMAPLPVVSYTTWTNVLSLQNIADASVQLIRQGD